MGRITDKMRLASIGSARQSATGRFLEDESEIAAASRRLARRNICVMKVHKSITAERLMEAVEARITSLNNPGFCILRRAA